MPNILGIIENWNRWSEMMIVKLPDFMSGSITFGDILSIRVLEWLVIQVGCKYKSIKGLKARESRSLFVWLSSL